MKHFPLLIVAALSTLAATAFGNTYELPDEKPVASVTVPSTWKQDKYEDGVECVSPDNEVFLSVEGIQSEDLESAVVDAVKLLKKRGVTINKESEKHRVHTLGDLELTEVIWDGKDEDGACAVSLSFIPVTKKKGLMVVFWSAPEVAKKNDAELGRIIRSIKPLEK